MKDKIEQLSDELQKTRNILEGTYSRIRKTTADNESLKILVSEARNNFSLDILNLQEQLRLQYLHSEDFEYITVKQLDLTKTFDESVKNAWELHKKQIEDHFNVLLRKVTEQQEIQRIKINKFERLCEDGNQLVPIKQMTADFLLGKLVIIE